MNPPGWHGKLPSLGDFASRRLDPAFVEAWDDWLARGLLALRERDPEGWLAAYLASPSWRFLLLPAALPGTVGAQGWAGVLMPSVDRVGRYFPLTIALPLVDGPSNCEQMTGLWSWLGRLDELARDALHEDWTAEQLESELAGMALPVFGAGAETGASGEARALAPDQRADMLDAAAAIGAQAHQAWAAQARGQAWWQAVPDEGPRRLWVTAGLPSAADFAQLLGRAPTSADTIAADSATLTP